MVKRKFENSWCEELTRCPVKPTFYIGSYECVNCPFHEGMITDTTDEYAECDNCDYKKYSVVATTGTVFCSYDELNNKKEDE